MSFLLGLFKALRAVPLWVYLALAGLVWVGSIKVEAYRANKALAVKTVEAAAHKAAAAETGRLREVEQAMVVGVAEVTDELSRTQARASAARRAFDERMRAAASAAAASAAAAAASSAGRSAGAAAGGALSEQARADLADLVQDADAVASRLKACQSVLVLTRQACEASNAR